MKVHEYFEGHGWFDGSIVRVLANNMYKVKYSDGTNIDESENEVRQWIDVRENSEWKRLVAAAKAGFDYLKGRLNGSCNNVNYDCTEVWEVLRLLKAFDPSYASSSLDASMARDLVKIKRPASQYGSCIVAGIAQLCFSVSGFHCRPQRHCCVHHIRSRLVG